MSTADSYLMKNFLQYIAITYNYEIVPIINHPVVATNFKN